MTEDEKTKWVLSLPKDYKVKLIKDFTKEGHVEQLLVLLKIFLDAPISEGGLSVEEIEAIRKEAKEKVELIVWTDRKPKKAAIDLDAEQLRTAVSSGHDHDFDHSIIMIKYAIGRGDKKGTTDMTRYHGGGSDTVYWELKESVNETKIDQGNWCHPNNE